MKIGLNIYKNNDNAAYILSVILKKMMIMQECWLFRYTPRKEKKFLKS